MLHQIGSGVLGPVFRAHEPGRDRIIAIKAFKLDLLPEDVARLAAALRRLAATTPAHPLIVPFVDAGLEGTTPFLASEYALGETLDVALRQLAPAPLARALAILAPLADAVDSAWSTGRGHGALHPRDVFVDPVTKAVTHVTGFGIVPALEEVGAPAPARRPYAAPERAAGKPWGIRADVYAVGAIAHELLAGRRPAGPGEQNGVFAPDLTPEARVGVRRVLAYALAADPADRYASAVEFVSALDAVSRGEAAPRPVRAGADAPAGATLFDMMADPVGDVASTDAASAVDRSLAMPGPAAPIDLPIDLLIAAPVAAPIAPSVQIAADVAADAVVEDPKAAETIVTSVASASVASATSAMSPTPEPVSPIFLGPVPASDETAADARSRAATRAADTFSILSLGRPGQQDESRAEAPAPVIVTRTAWGPIGATAAAALVLGAVGGYFLGARRASPAGPVTPVAGAALSADTEVAVAPNASPSRPGSSNPSSAVGDPSAQTSAPLATATPDVRRAAAPSGRLTVRSVPAGAMVTIDGRVSGETPLTVRDLSLGPHTLQVARPGHAPRTERVNLTAAVPTRTLTFALEPGVRAAPATHGAIDVDSRPRGARVLVDGRVLGSTPLRAPEVLPGAHVVTFELDGFVSATARTVVVAGKASIVKVTLERKPGVTPVPASHPGPEGPGLRRR